MFQNNWIITFSINLEDLICQNSLIFKAPFLPRREWTVVRRSVEVKSGRRMVCWVGNCRTWQEAREGKTRPATSLG